MVMLLLILSGNVQPNPGSNTFVQCLPTPSDIRSKTGLGFLHLNFRGLVPKMDMIKIWANTTNAEIMVLFETQFKKSATDDLISIDGYKIYRTDHVGKGGGVAMYVKSKLITSITLSITKEKLWFWPLKWVYKVKDSHMTMVGGYIRPIRLKGCSQIYLRYFT